jgi:hypothetical protein
MSKAGEIAMNGCIRKATQYPIAISLFFLFASTVWIEAQTKNSAGQSSASSGTALSSPSENKVVAEADGTAEKLGTTIPNSFSRLNMLVDWVEKKVAPPISATVTGGNRSLPMCSHPAYPKYINGPVEKADSYKCTKP